jgi:alpha-beta hydrolase superfamily lysophospholipase
MGEQSRADSFFRRAIWTFRKNNEDRIIQEYEQTGHALTDVEKKTLTSNMYGITNGEAPEDPLAGGSSKYFELVRSIPEHYLSPWKRQFKQVEAPGYVWMDPKQKVHAIVFSIHGLGLHHKAYEPLAKSLAPHGIMTIAMDVRGFGTFMEAAGFEKLSMRDCVEDLKGIVRTLRKDYPNTPLFVLGESMGGALALRVVAELPGEVDGLICSVPSGSRYGSTATALRIGANFLLDKTKPVPVGYSVVKQATQNPEVQRCWIDDPNSRLQLSPEELINFQLFMDENPKFATQIKDKPVILFQGHNDRLVKEQGTLDLFDALGTPQKTIILLGDTEHLIFEAGQFKAELPLLLDAWIKSHSKRSESL